VLRHKERVRDVFVYVCIELKVTYYSYPTNNVFVH